MRKITKAITGLFWRALAATMPNQVDRITQGGSRCPRCRGDLLTVFRFGGHGAGFVWWGSACDDCGLELGAPGFVARARAQGARIRQEVAA